MCTDAALECRLSPEEAPPGLLVLARGGTTERREPTCVARPRVLATRRVELEFALLSSIVVQEVWMGRGRRGQRQQWGPTNTIGKQRD